jgi:L-iditol 2-dehydrogenase
METETKMRAVRLFAPGDLRCVEVPIPRQAEGEVLIQVKAVGICGSDPARVMVKGTYSFPTTIGHEFAGVITECGPGVEDWKLGDRVTIVPLIPCYKCDYCQVGEYTLCDTYGYYGSREDGALADYIKVKAANLLRLPDNVSYEEGACTDPSSVALHAVRKGHVQPGDTVVVLGCGPIGHLTIEWAKICGAGRVIAVDVDDEKLEIARKVGADLCINGRKEDPVSVIMDHTKGQGAERVFEMAGNKVTQEQAFLITKKLGTAVFCGISNSELLLSKKAVDSFLRREIKAVGSWNSSFTELPVHDWKCSLDFMSRGKIQCEPLITHRFSLEEAPEVFRRVFYREESFNKVLFLPEM